MLFLSTSYILPYILKMVNETAVINKSVSRRSGAGVVRKSYLAINYPLLCSNVQCSESKRVSGSPQTAIHCHIPLLQSAIFAGNEGLYRNDPLSLKITCLTKKATIIPCNKNAPM